MKQSNKVMGILPRAVTILTIILVLMSSDAFSQIPACHYMSLLEPDGAGGYIQWQWGSVISYHLVDVPTWLPNTGAIIDGAFSQWMSHTDTNKLSIGVESGFPITFYEQGYPGPPGKAAVWYPEKNDANRIVGGRMLFNMTEFESIPFLVDLVNGSLDMI